MNQTGQFRSTASALRLHCILAMAALTVPAQAMAQERRSGSTPWSTEVQYGGNPETPTRAPRKGARVQRPATGGAAPLPAAAQSPALPGAMGPSVEIPPPPAAPFGTGSDAAAAATPSERSATEQVTEEYCRNIGPIAGEARAAFLQQAIASQERELSRKTAELEARIAEHRQWMLQRQQVLNQAGSALVQMFARMRPEAAAQQLAIMDETVAAVLLMKLEPKSSSALLSEMQPSRAARITAIIAAAADISPRPRAAKSEPTR